MDKTIHALGDVHATKQVSSKSTTFFLGWQSSTSTNEMFLNLAKEETRDSYVSDDWIGRNKMLIQFEEI